MAVNRKLILAVLAVALSTFTSKGIAFAITRSFSGDVTAQYRLSKTDDREATTQQVYSGRIATGGYLWRPWFAGWAAQLGISEQLNDNGDASTTGNTLTGSAQVDVLRRSRYPMNLFLSVSDSRVDSEGSDINDSDIRVTRYGITQNYQPVSANGSYQGTYERFIQESGSLDASQTSDLFRVTGTHQMERQIFAASLAYRNSESGISGSTDKVTALNLNHSYRHGENMSLNSAFAVNQQELEGGGNVGQTFQDLDLNSQLFWRDRKRPLTARATFDYRRTSRDFEGGGAGTEIDNYKLNGSARYQFTDALSGNLDLGVAAIEASNSSTQSFFQAASLTYSPRAIRLGNVNYRWGTTGSLRNETTSGDDSRQDYRVNFNHGVNQGLPLGDGSSFYLSWNADQDIDVSGSNESDNLYNISHGVSSTINHGVKNGYSSLRLFARDTRSRGDADIGITSLGMSLSYRKATSRSSAWNLEMNSGQTITETDGRETETSSSTVNLSYLDSEFLGVHRLRLDSLLSLQSDQFIPFVSNADEERQQLSWRNTMLYQIGLLNMEFTASFSKSGSGRLTQNYLLRLTRTF